MVPPPNRSVRWPAKSKRQEALSAALLRKRAEACFRIVLMGSMPIQVAGTLLAVCTSEAEVEWWGIAASAMATLLTLGAAIYRQQMRAWHVRCRTLLRGHS
jgi:hypothetical protein